MFVVVAPANQFFVVEVVLVFVALANQFFVVEAALAVLAVAAFGASGVTAAFAVVAVVVVGEARLRLASVGGISSIAVFFVAVLVVVFGKLGIVVVVLPAAFVKARLVSVRVGDGKEVGWRVVLRSVAETRAVVSVPVELDEETVFEVPVAGRARTVVVIVVLVMLPPFEFVLHFGKFPSPSQSLRQPSSLRLEMTTGLEVEKRVQHPHHQVRQFGFPL